MSQFPEGDKVVRQQGCVSWDRVSIARVYRLCSRSKPGEMWVGGQNDLKAFLRLV